MLEMLDILSSDWEGVGERRTSGWGCAAGTPDGSAEFCYPMQESGFVLVVTKNSPKSESYFLFLTRVACAGYMLSPHVRIVKNKKLY